jgi:ubiquinone/menaquinone biosynthesis C-methylase UbiE
MTDQNAERSPGAATARQPKVRHPIFARVYLRLSDSTREQEAPLRQELLAGLSGAVIEVGSGQGENFPHFPPEVTRVLAVEPEPYLRQKAIDAAKEASVEIEVVDGVAENLPADTETFDAGVACFVLCTVGDQTAALADVRRVIRPGGELRFLEHVIANSSGLSRLQRLSDRTWWPLVGGGCHSARDTAASIKGAGFEIERSRRFPFRPSWVEFLVTPHILGAARRP